MSNLKVCENCEFMVQQINVNRETENMCILENVAVGIFHGCTSFREKRGEHITKV